jgi:hypothetical protein
MKPPSAARLLDWLPELVALLLGVAVRVTMLTRYHPTTGFDFVSHWKYVEWFRSHSGLPDILYSRETHQAPLYYFIAGRLLRAGASLRIIAGLSVLLGILRLAVFAVGLRLLLPKSTWKWPRLVGLVLAALLPASVHIDGMVNCEVLLGFLSAVLMLLAAATFRRRGRARVAWAVALGAVAGLDLLAKISALALIAALGTTALLELLADRTGGWRARAGRFAPFLLALAVAGATSAFYLAHNQRHHGKPIVSSYDGKDGTIARPQFEHIPLWKRRSLAYLTCWTVDIYVSPMWPSGYEPRPCLFPVLVATTFADYYNYHFAPARRGDELKAHAMPNETALALSRASVAAGTAIAALSVGGWLVLLIGAWRRRAFDAIAPLLCPLFALLGQIWYAWAYPVDWEGPVKGTLLQYSLLPMCAVFGIVVCWSWRRGRAWRLITVVGLLALAGVASYTGYCRVASPPVVLL